MVETIENFTKQAQATTSEASRKLEGMMADYSERAKAAAEKGMKLASEAGAFGKANVEAVVESGKIAVEGVQAISRDNLEFAKGNFEHATAAMKDFGAAKSPTEFMQLHSDYARKSFDTMVQQTSKNSEAMLKLVGEMMRPLSNRVAVAVEKARELA